MRSKQTKREYEEARKEKRDTPAYMTRAQLIARLQALPQTAKVEKLIADIEEDGIMDLQDPAVRRARSDKGRAL